MDGTLEVLALGAVLGAAAAGTLARGRKVPTVADHRLIGAALGLGWGGLEYGLHAPTIAALWLGMTVAAWLVLAALSIYGGGGGGGEDDEPEPDGPGGGGVELTPAEVLDEAPVATARKVEARS